MTYLGAADARAGRLSRGLLSVYDSTLKTEVLQRSDDSSTPSDKSDYSIIGCNFRNI